MHGQIPSVDQDAVPGENPRYAHVSPLPPDDDLFRKPHQYDVESVMQAEDGMIIKEVKSVVYTENRTLRLDIAKN